MKTVTIYQRSMGATLELTGRWRITIENDIQYLKVEAKYKAFTNTERIYGTLKHFWQKRPYTTLRTPVFETGWFLSDELDILIREDLPIQEC